jgi:sortase A
MLKLLERALLVIGLACVGYYALAVADARQSEQEARAAIKAVLATPILPVEKPATPAEKWLETPVEKTPETPVEKKPETPIEKTPETAVENPAMGSNLIGLLEIPRLNLSTAVVEGDSGDALNGTAGHLPDTPRPWEKGNSAIAAHRDQQFRALRNIRVGDELRVQTPHGEIIYQVSDTHIVMPTDLSVLKPKSEQMLTLITCYPFYYVGSAPKRFIVHAERVNPQRPLPRVSAKPAAKPRARIAAGARTGPAAATNSKSPAASRPRPKATKSIRAGSPASSQERQAAARRR